MAANADFINILREIRGTQVPGQPVTDGIWYELTIADKNGNPGVYGDILAKYGLIVQNAPTLEQAVEILSNLNVQVTGLPAGSEPTSALVNGVWQLGIPVGASGEDGNDGHSPVVTATVINGVLNMLVDGVTKASVNIGSIVDSEVTSNVGVQQTLDAKADVLNAIQDAEVLIAGLDTTVADKKVELGYYADAKKNEIIDATADGLVQLTTAENASIDAIEARVSVIDTQMTNTYNIKLAEYNTNHTAKLSQYNTNALEQLELANAKFNQIADYFSDLAANGGYLLSVNNLSDLPDKAVARTNLDVYSKNEIATVVNNAVASLVDSAPTTLDTLNELAAALGDDPNFATTTANAIGANATAISNEVTRATNAEGVIQSNLDTHTSRVDNPHAVTKTQVGLSEVDNTSDATKWAAVATLTNKTIDSITNKIGADHVHYKVKAAGNLVAGDVVKITGYNSGEDAVEVNKVTSNSDVAVGIVEEAIAVGTFGAVTNTGMVEGLDTSAWTFGTILYSNGTGGLTSTKPTSGIYQACAIVLRSNANTGALLVEFTEPVQIASTTQSGYVQLNNTLTSTSTTQALTAAQGKVLQDGKQPLDATLTALAGVTTAADKIVYATGVDTFSTSTLSAFARTLIDDTDATTARTTLGLTIGTNVQAYDAGLLSIAGLTTAADKMLYTTASDVYVTTTLTAAGRALIDDADASAQRTTLGISATNTPSTAVGNVSATNVQAAIQELDSEKVAKSVVVTTAITSVTFNADGTITIVTP